MKWIHVTNIYSFPAAHLYILIYYVQMLSNTYNLCKFVMSLQEIVKYSHCFVNFLLTRSYVCPLRELAVPSGQWVTLLSCFATVWEYSPSSFFYGLTTIEVYCNFRVAGLNIFIEYNIETFLFVMTIFYSYSLYKTQRGYLSFFCDQ